MRRLPGIILAAILLAGLTVLAWQFRFEHAGPLLGGFDQEFSFTKRKEDPAVSIEKTFGTMPGVRFLRVAVDAEWTDAVQSGDILWARARGILFGRTPEGVTHWPPDHGLFSALGTRDWHREEAVFDLPPDLGNVGFSFQHLGESGTLELRNIEISVVKQRSWFPAATVTLIALWVTWVAAIISPHLGRWRWIRAILAGCAVVGATWFLVFPQPRFSARTLIGGFQLGAPLSTPPQIAIPAPPPPSAAAPTVTPLPPPQPTPPSAPPIPAPPAAEPPTPIASEAPQEKRESHTIGKTIRDLRSRFNFLHLVAFGAFGLVLFGLANVRTWPIAAVIVFASEALPNYQLHQPWDWGDIGDLASDSLGLALAAFAITVIRRFWRRRASESSGPGISASAAPP